MKVNRWTRNCVACEASIASTANIDTKEPCNDRYIEAIQCRCETCAGEIAGLRLPRHGTFNYGTGGGQRVIRESKTH